MSTVAAPHSRLREKAAVEEKVVAVSRPLALVVTTLQMVLAASIWLISRPYLGIVHDARIYVGRAVANLDPSGVGRDLMFSLDGQTQLTIYSVLIQPLVRIVGPSAAAMALSLSGLLLWLAAAWWLAGRLVPKRMIPAALICAALLPAVYGPFGIFSYGESFAAPRCLAEAAVIAAMAALLDRRLLVCGVLLACAALLHPIMALAGLGVAFLVLAFEQPRWWLLVPAGVVGACGAALAHVGPAKTLFTAFDPTWLAVLRIRDPFLFESEWNLGAWSGAMVSASTVLIAGILAQGRVRKVLLASVIVAVCGVATAYVLAELTSNVLLLRLQIWRVLWLVQLLAALAAPVCAVQLFASGRRDHRAVLAMLACAWSMGDVLAVTAPCCLVALGVTALGRADPDDISSLAGRTAWLCAGGLAGLSWSMSLFVSIHVISGALHAGAPVRLAYVLNPNTLRIPVIGAALGLLLLRRPVPIRVQVVATAALVAVLAPFAMLTWDQRTPTRLMIDRAEGRAELRRRIGTGQGGVVWVGNDVAPWFWAGEPTWLNTLQGSVGAFSRPLAMTWNVRSQALLRSGLGAVTDRNPWATHPPPPMSAPKALKDGAVRLCRTPDGPDAIIISGDIASLFAPSQAVAWKAPRSDVILNAEFGNMQFIRQDDYTIVHCGALSPKPASGS